MDNRELALMILSKVEKIDDKLDKTNVKVGKIEENIRLQEKRKFGLNIPIIIGLILGGISGIVSLIIHFI